MPKLEQLVPYEVGAESRPRAGTNRLPASPRSWWRSGGGRPRLIPGGRDVIALTAGILALAGFAGAQADAAPCAKHRGDARDACLQHRAKQAFPRSPSWGEALARLSAYEERSLLAIGRCEMGTRAPGYKKARRGFPPASSPWASLRWGLDYSRYSTAFGIWNGNGHYIRRATGGYSFPGRTPAEELLGAKALADGPARGFSGWACHGRS